MATDEDIAALINLIRYSEDEAVRLRVQEVVVRCLRMAAMEMASAITKTKSDDGTGDAKVA
jgi:hypothetical protein